MEIHNLYSLDIFLQGTFLLVCLAIGLYLVFNDNLEKLKTSESVSKLSFNIHELVKQIAATASLNNILKEPKGSLKYLGIVPLIIIASFILGILGYGIADEWIDSKSKNHLYLKPLWLGDLSLNNREFKRIEFEDVKIDTFSHYKKRIRYKSFLQVFNPKNHKTKAKIIEQLYFHAKHEIIKDQNYYSYIRKSQTLAEYSRVFALGFFILFICGLVNMFIMLIRIIFTSKKELAGKYSDELSKSSKNWSDKKFDIPDLVIVIFNLLSALFIIVIIGSDLGNILTHGVFIYVICVLLSFFGSFTFFLNLSGKFRILRFSFFIYSILYIISFLGYYGSSKMWISSENLVSKKVFGIYKSAHKSDKLEEIEYAQDSLHLRLFPPAKDGLRE